MIKAAALKDWLKHAGNNKYNEVISSGKCLI